MNIRPPLATAPLKLRVPSRMAVTTALLSAATATPLLAAAF